MKEISARLGHADLATTANLYTQVDDHLARKSANRLATFIDDGHGGQHHNNHRQRGST